MKHRRAWPACRPGKVSLPARLPDADRLSIQCGSQTNPFDAAGSNGGRCSVRIRNNASPSTHQKATRGGYAGPRSLSASCPGILGTSNTGREWQIEWFNCDLVCGKMDKVAKEAHQTGPSARRDSGQPGASTGQCSRSAGQLASFDRVCYVPDARCSPAGVEAPPMKLLE